jgi:amino acid transporter
VPGVLKGISAVFFAYIGFDAISTTAEECRNPQRDLPRAMFISLFVCTVLYILIALVLTGIVPYHQLGVGDPLAFVFETIGKHKLAGVISFSAVVAMASVLLVFQLGQPRIWMAMSRDGLLPKIFSSIHPKFKTPWFATIVTGLCVAIPALFMNLTEVTDLTSIGTLFAFCIVCAGVIIMDENGSSQNAKFKIPFISSKKLLPILLLGIIVYYIYDGLNNPTQHLFTNTTTTADFVLHIVSKLLMFMFAVAAIWRNWSAIAVLGFLSNFYMMSQLGSTNWIRFILWLILGLIIYFLYSKKNSVLNIAK